jgi:nitrogen fixation protein NifQ
MGADPRIEDARSIRPGDRELCGIVERLVGPNGPEARFAAEVEERRVEFDALVETLMRDATMGPNPQRAEAVARAIAAGCLGERHLWRDMELPNRRALRALFDTYFAPIAADNYMDMRWKKFIYRRLCRWGGFNSCPAPSCSACSSYDECFGSAG